MRKTVLLFAMLCVASGCQKAADDTAEVSPKVLRAAEISDAIKANPDQAEEILAKHDMTAESFADLMYEIAADEKMSADFERSRKR